MFLRILGLGLTVLVSAGCAAPDIRPTAEALANPGTIQLVPVESPRLELSEWSFASSPGGASYVPPPPVGSAAAQGIMAGLQLLTQIPTRPDDAAARLKQAQVTLDASTAWNPAVDFAHEAARLLSEADHPAAALSEARPLPMADADLLRTESLARLAMWFNATSPMGATSHQAGASAYLGEISVRYAALTDRMLFVNVYMKLFNAGSGELIGRTRVWQRNARWPRLPPMETVLADDARQLKEMVIKEGNTLIPECLQNLGLLPAKLR